MRVTTLAAVGLLVTAVACSHSKESQKQQQEETAQSQGQEGQALEPMVGIVSSVDPERIELQAEGSEEPETFERTSRTLVLRDGREVAWEELGEGEAVRVTYDAGIFGPDRLNQVEILAGSEAERIRSGAQRPETESPLGPEGIESPMEPGALEPRPVEPLSPPGSQMPEDDAGF